MSLWPKVREELNVIVNKHFETPEYHQLFSVKLTPERQKIWDIHYPHYIKSRRDCWGAAAVRLDRFFQIFDPGGDIERQVAPKIQRFIVIGPAVHTEHVEATLDQLRTSDISEPVTVFVHVDDRDA